MKAVGPPETDSRRAWLVLVVATDSWPSDAAATCPVTPAPMAKVALEPPTSHRRAPVGRTTSGAVTRRYERARMPRTAAIVELSRSNARLFMVRGPLVFARDLAIRFAPERAILGRLVAMTTADLEPPP